VAVKKDQLSSPQTNNEKQNFGLAYLARFLREKKKTNGRAGANPVYSSTAGGDESGAMWLLSFGSIYSTYIIGEAPRVTDTDATSPGQRMHQLRNTKD
jgi:hypothetical protein